MNATYQTATFQTLFHEDTPSVYNMPSGANFLKELAKGLKAGLGKDLASAMILLPTRRAVRELSDAFVSLDENGAVLLPLMRTLADMDDNEPPFAPGEVDLGIPPSIDPVHHTFELAQLIVRKMKASGDMSDPDAASALAMTEPLVSMLSDLAMEELDHEALGKLDEDIEFLPAHFQSAAEFAKIVAKYWPEHLKSLGLSEPMARRVALLNAAAEVWESKPPQHPVIVAGSTGTLAATARLIKAIKNMPEGLVVLPGLDKNIDNLVWDNIDDQHPQASLKHLIQTLNVDREDIQNWPEIPLNFNADMRAKILAESLIPADSTFDWPERIKRVKDRVSDGDPLVDGLNGLSLIEAKTEDEEAGTIALIMREALQTPGKTAALITPDPSLARRVRAKLSRFGVEVDSSAGEPLEETLHGSFLALSLDLALDPFDPVALSGLMRHKLFAPDILLKHSPLLHWENLEKQVFRGRRPTNIDEVEANLKGKNPEGFRLYAFVQENLSALTKLKFTDQTAGEFAREHAILLEKMAGGAKNIWRSEAGEKAARLIEELMEYSHLLPNVDGAGYARLLSMIMRGRVVRPRYGTETRLHILGPLEARMINADVFILGGLNEGIWPAPPSLHPVLSRGMRMKIGLSTPERRFGLAAHDFAQLAAKPNVILTRAQNTSDGPAVQSRWLWRLTTFVKGAGKINELGGTEHYLDWTRTLDKAPDIPKLSPRPAPRPALNTRWPDKTKGRRLSVTQISTLVRDPYAIYARHVLDLHPLSPLDQAIGGAEFGTAIHKALETIDKATPSSLLASLKAELLKTGFVPHEFSRMDVRLERMTKWLMDWAEQRKSQGWSLVSAEKKGKMVIETDGGDFTLVGVPDRIEKSADGLAIIDYKTGVIPSAKEVKAGFQPQLPLLSIMLFEGKLGKESERYKGDCAKELLYIKPNATSEKAITRSISKSDIDGEEYAHNAYESLKKLIAHFDDPQTPYYSQPRSQYTNTYGEYDQLARRAEWASLQEGDT